MRYSSRAFSLVEILVATAILVLIAGVIYGQLDRSWAKARDAQRKEDVQRLAYAIELWYQEYGTDPDCNQGTVIEDVPISDLRILPNGSDCIQQTEFVNYITSVLGELPTDPLGPQHPDYYYYYDSSHNCYQDTAEVVNDGFTIVFAANLETEQTNQFEYCVTQSGNDGGYVYTSNNQPVNGTKQRPPTNVNGNTAKMSPDDPGSQPYIYVLKQ